MTIDLISGCAKSKILPDKVKRSIFKSHIYVLEARMKIQGALFSHI